MSEDAQFKEAVGPLRLTALASFVLIIGVTLWMIFAQISTVMRANGRFVSSEPSFELQHPFGGQIDQIYVELHSKVHRGDLMIRLDVAKQQEILGKLSDQHARIVTENRVISALLSGEDVRLGGDIALRYQQMRRELAINIEASERTLNGLVAQRAQIEDAVARLEESRALMVQSNAQIEQSVAKGYRAKQDLDSGAQAHLRLLAEISRQRADLVDLADGAEQTMTKKILLEETFERDLRGRLAENVKQLPNLERQMIELRQEIYGAEIRAPIDGAVSTLSYTTSGMYVPRGQSIMMLSRPLSRPKIVLDIPVDLIDQIHEGMTAWVTISGLPTRNFKRVSARISSISPQAKRDENDTPVAYQATAFFDAGSLEDALASSSVELSLAQDMPVTLAIEGRRVTLAQFLITPFFESFSAAFQD